MIPKGCPKAFSATPGQGHISVVRAEPVDATVQNRKHAAELSAYVRRMAHQQRMLELQAKLK